MIWCYTPQWIHHEIPSWSLIDVVFSFPSEVSIIISSGSLDDEALSFLVKFVWYSPVKSEKGDISLHLYESITIILWCDYFQTIFLFSGIKPLSRNLFPQLMLTLLWNFSSWMWFSWVLTLTKLILSAYFQCCMSILLAYTW